MLAGVLGALVVLLIGVVMWFPGNGVSPTPGVGTDKPVETPTGLAQAPPDGEHGGFDPRRDAAAIGGTEFLAEPHEPGEPEVAIREVTQILADFWGPNWPEIEAEIRKNHPRLLEVSAPPPQPWAAIEEMLDVVVDEWASDPFWKDKIVSKVTNTEAGSPWVVPLTVEHLNRRGNLDVDDPDLLAEHTLREIQLRTTNLLRDIDRARADLVESVRTACYRLIRTGRVTKHLYAYTTAADRAQGYEGRVDGWFFSIPHRGYFIHFRLPKSEFPEIEQNRRQLIRMTMECNQLIRSIVGRG